MGDGGWDSLINAEMRWRPRWASGVVTVGSWSSPEGQNEMVRDDDTHYGYGLSTCDVRVPIRTSPTGPSLPFIYLTTQSLFCCGQYCCNMIIQRGYKMKKFKKSENQPSIDNKGHLASLQQSEIWDQACTSLDHVTENGEWCHNWLTGPIKGKSLLFEVLEFLVALCQVTCRQVQIFHGETQYFMANR